jgi:ketosteroid isomerase-like protein
MFRLVLVIVTLLAVAPAYALDPDSSAEADHEALRQLKVDLVAALNAQDFGALGQLFNEPFTSTVITQDRFTDLDSAKIYFNQLFTRPEMKMASVKFQADSDALSTIFTGTFALSTGTTIETYTLADGRVFDIQGRWTAVSVKDGDGWKLAGFHGGTNFLDNPVLNAVKDSVPETGAVAAAGGLVIGLLGGWFIGRRRSLGA